MRGKERQQPRQQRVTRITPAYAGKRLLPLPVCSRLRDHPRVCGEKYFTIRDKVAKKGSPPRMRGKD